MKRLLIFDGNALIHRAYHAIPPLTDKNGRQVNALYGVVSMLFSISLSLRPTHIVFCFDTPEPTFRKKELASYQANRPEMEDKLSSQFEFVYEFLNNFRIPFYMKPGFEADDVIGTIATGFSKKNKDDEVVIVTGDRDILQLVSENVFVYMPKNASTGQLLKSNDVFEKMGVTPPSKIIFYKALVGDASDNYKGVPGIGPKTAVSLISAYDNLDDLYANLDKVNEKVRAKLVEYKNSAYLSEKLATIVTNLDVSFAENEAVNFSFEDTAIYDKYGFKTLKERGINATRELGKGKQPSLF